MPDLLPIGTDDMIEEVRRELTLRHKVYPRMVAKGRLSAARAERQTEVLAAVLEFLNKHRALSQNE